MAVNKQTNNAVT